MNGTALVRPANGLRVECVLSLISNKVPLDVLYRLEKGLAGLGIRLVQAPTYQMGAPVVGQADILYAALHEAYFVALGVAIFGLACCLLMPAGADDQHAYEEIPEPELAP